MMQLHIFLSILLVFPFLSINAMHTAWENDPHAQKKISAVRAINSVFHYVNKHNLTLANAHAELEKQSAEFKKQCGLTYYEIIALPTKSTLSQDYIDAPVLARFKIASLKQGILICINLTYDLQKIMLRHLGFEEQSVQDDFLRRPLSQSFEWLAQCRNKPFTELPARFLLNYEQYYCMEAIKSKRNSKSGKDMYVDADSHEDIKNPLVIITPEQKEILLSLPLSLVKDLEKNDLLHDINIAEKPSAATKLFLPLNMVFHSLRNMEHRNSFRSCIQFLSPYHSRAAFSLLTSMVISKIYEFYNNDLLLCTENSLLVHLLANNCKTMYRLFFDPQAGVHNNNNNNYNTCIVKHSPIHWQDILFIALTSVEIFASKYLNNMPLSTIFSGIAISLAPFVVYDYFKYGIRYGITVQSPASFIQNHKQNKKRSFFTLI